jgi:hypothetical protein
MGLEAPLALLGLLAVLLPLLAHRTRQRDLKHLPFPTLQLLARAEVKKRSRRSWTDRLLLLLRMALLAIACLAVAAPFVNARLAFGDGRISSAVIVVDDSMSMLRSDGRESLLEQARERAQSVIESLPEGSELSVVAAGKPARLLVPLTDDRNAALALLSSQSGDAAEALRATDMDGALALAAQQLGAAQHGSRRLLLLSDFAAHAQPTPAALALDAVALQAERIGGPPERGNLFFQSVDASADPTLPGQLSLAIQLGSRGPAIAQASLRISSGGKELAQLEVTLAEGQGRAISHVPIAAEGEDPTALIEIMTVDALAADNRIGVLRQAASGPRVLLVNGDPRPASPDDELYFLQQALLHAPGVSLWSGARQIDASALEHHDLAAYDVVVLANVETPSARWVQRAQAFVSAGGGLLLAPGDHFELRPARERYGELLAAPVRSVSSDSLTGLTARAPAPFFSAGPSGLTQVQTRKRLLLEAESGSWLDFADGSSALAVAARGRGRVALLALPLDDDWSDLPMRPGYMALVSALIGQLAQLGSDDGRAESGKPRSIELPENTDSVEVVDPDGERVRRDAPPASYVYQAARGAGPYRVLLRPKGGTLKDAPRKAFLVQAPGADSDLTPGPVPDPANVPQSAGVARPQLRRSLSPVFFSLAGLLVLCEALLRSRFSRRRAG